MLSFSFGVNASFRGYPSHPITIPRSRVDYRVVDRLTTGATEVTIAFLNGARIPAKIYSGIAGFGEYRQIRTVGTAESPLFLAKDGQTVEVSLKRTEQWLEITVRGS